MALDVDQLFGPSTVIHPERFVAAQWNAVDDRKLYAPAIGPSTAGDFFDVVSSRNAFTAGRLVRPYGRPLDVFMVTLTTAEVVLSPLASVATAASA